MIFFFEKQKSLKHLTYLDWRKLENTFQFVSIALIYCTKFTNMNIEYASVFQDELKEAMICFGQILAILVIVQLEKLLFLPGLSIFLHFFYTLGNYLYVYSYGYFHRFIQLENGSNPNENLGLSSYIVCISVRIHLPTYLFDSLIPKIGQIFVRIYFP